MTNIFKIILTTINTKDKYEIVTELGSEQCHQTGHVRSCDPFKLK